MIEKFECKVKGEKFINMEEVLKQYGMAIMYSIIGIFFVGVAVSFFLMICYL